MTSPSRRVSGRFWFVPAACGIVSLLVGVALARLDRAIGDDESAFLFPGPPEGARSFLGAVITAMISFTGLVFSITVVVLVLTSGQFSPRVLRQFLRDRTIQWSLGLFVSTFLYAIVVLREVLGTNGTDAFVPRISVTVAFVLVLVAVAQFVHYIHHVVHMIQASSIIISIGAETRDLLETRHPPDTAAAAPEPVLTGRGVDAATAVPGTLVFVDETRLLRRCTDDDTVVTLAAHLGDFLPAGATLLTVHPCREGTVVDTAAYAADVQLADERTMDQDLAFGLRQLVDLATKALSPSINDPTTATQVLDVLHDLLRRIVSRPWPPTRLTDPAGATRVTIPRHDVEGLIRIALAEVQHYGSSSTQVPERMTRLLDDLETVARREHLDALHRVRAELDRAAG